MKVVRSGTLYVANNFGSKEDGQVIQFTESDGHGGYIPGTTNEEVIEILIDRFEWLNTKNPSEENTCSLVLLKNLRRLQTERLRKKQQSISSHEQQNHSFRQNDEG